MAKMESFTDHDLDKLFITIAENIYETEMSHGGSYWPFNPIRFHIAIASNFFRELYRLIHTLEGNGYSIKDIATLFVNPNKVADYNFMWPFVKGLSLEEKRYLAVKILEILDFLRNKDPFCENQRNTIWSQKKLEMEVNRSVFFHKDENIEIFENLVKIETLLNSYAELIYFMFPGFSRMYHGPYTHKGQIVIVKEFYDLVPIDVWGFTTHFPFNHYRAIGLYNQSIEFKVHFVGLFESNIPSNQALGAWSIYLNGIGINNAQELKDYVTNVEGVINKGIAEISNLTQDILFEKGKEMFFYTLKQLYQAIGEEWHVPEKVSDYVPLDKRSIETKPLDDLPRHEAIDRILTTIDFRKNYYDG